MITIDGLISGIDTETIIDGLLDIQQTQIDRLEIRKQGLQGKQAAYESLEIQLQSLDSIADQLARPQASLFKSRTVNVSNESSLFASASTKAAVGTYQIHVDELARAHQVASAGFASTDTEITQGTLEIQVGDGDLQTITIDATNNTVQGLVDELNSAEAGLSATIINDGSNGGTPFRILLTASATGETNEIAITNNLAADNGSAVQPTFDLGNPVQAASNAQVRLGSGPGALTVQNETNQVDNLIQGVTLSLLNADVNEEIQVRVATNTEPAKTAINDLVDTYNAIMDFIDELVRYNPETDQAGLLIGDRTVTDIQNDVRSAVLDVVPGVNGSANRLSALGISLNNKARLTVNETQLEEVIAGRVEGVSEDDLQDLFSINGTDPDTTLPTGIGTRLGRLINNLTDVENGELNVAKDGLLDQLTSLDDSIKRQQTLFDNQQEDLIAQFVALETAISELQTTSSFLSSQLSNLGKIGDK